jgi:AraC-like DNA-binding protein
MLLSVMHLGSFDRSEIRRGEAPPSHWEALANVADYRSARLACFIDVSLTALQHHFLREYNYPLRHWLRGLRMNEAFRRICAGDPAKSVATDLGFKQLSHFSREFKTFHGFYPTLLGLYPYGAQNPQ